jgi:hypothetical protein
MHSNSAISISGKKKKNPLPPHTSSGLRILDIEKTNQELLVLVLVVLLLLSPNESAKENSFQQKERKVQFTQP